MLVERGKCTQSVFLRQKYAGRDKREYVGCVSRLFVGENTFAFREPFARERDIPTSKEMCVLM